MLYNIQGLLSVVHLLSHSPDGYHLSFSKGTRRNNHEERREELFFLSRQQTYRQRQLWHSQYSLWGGGERRSGCANGSGLAVIMYGHRPISRCGPYEGLYGATACRIHTGLHACANSCVDTVVDRAPTFQYSTAGL